MDDEQFLLRSREMKMNFCSFLYTSKIQMLNRGIGSVGLENSLSICTK